MTDPGNLIYRLSAFSPSHVYDLKARHVYIDTYARFYRTSKNISGSLSAGVSFPHNSRAQSGVLSTRQKMQLYRRTLFVCTCGQEEPSK